MRRLLLVKCMLFGGLILQAQDDIYDQPEPVKPRVVYQSQSSNMDRGDGSYENLDDNYNPEFDYRYRRSLRRMYDPYYVMPSSAFINMYSYPQFANFYNPYWGSGLVISVGNGWNDPWGWNNGWNSWGGGWNSWGNPYGWNSWNSWNAWNNPWGCHTGWNSWGGGWNNGWNSWGGGWNRNGWGDRNWNNGNRNSVNPPERRVSRAVRVMDPDRDYGNTRYRPSQNQNNSNRNSSPNTNNSAPVYRGSQSPSSPSPSVNPSPTRMGSMSPGSGGSGSSGGSSGGGSGRSGRSGGGSRF